MLALFGVGFILFFRVTERFYALFIENHPTSQPNSFELQRGLLVIRTMVAAAPLLGLLGTVNGIITTFQGIELGAQSELMSAGIGQALKTTQYGLTIAAPGLLAERILTRRSEFLLKLGMAPS